MALVRISIYNENSGNLIHEADDYSGDESDHSIYQALLKAFDEMSSLLFPDDEALVWEDEEEDEDEFSLGLIERPEPTMDDLEGQRLWNKWMDRNLASAMERYVFPQRFVVGIDPACPPDSYYVFSEAPVLTPNEWARGIEVEWGAREPLAFTRANKQAFTDLIETTVLSNSAFDFGDPDHDFTD